MFIAPLSVILMFLFCSLYILNAVRCPYVRNVFLVLSSSTLEHTLWNTLDSMGISKLNCL